MLKDTFAAWSKDKVPRHGAALAYYTVLSLVPLLVVIIAMIGWIFGRDAAQSYILEQMGSLVGPQSAEAIKEMIQRASQPSTGSAASSQPASSSTNQAQSSSTNQPSSSQSTNQTKQ